MKKLVLAVLTVLTLVGAASAAAYTTAPMSGRHDLLVCFRGGVIGSSDDPRFVAPANATAAPPGQVRGGPIGSSDVVYLSIAWGTYTEAQVRNFLRVQNGTITVRDVQGATVASVSWPTGNVDYWTAPFLVNNAGGGGGGMSQLWQSRLYVPVGPFPTGTYSIDVSLQITKPSFDGETTYQPGTWFALAGCQMTVS